MLSSLQGDPQQPACFAQPSVSRVQKWWPISFGNPTLGAYKGVVYTTGGNSLTQPTQIVLEDAERVKNMFAMVEAPPEQVRE